MSSMFDFFKTKSSPQRQQSTQQQPPATQQPTNLPANPAGFPAKNDSQTKKTGLDLFTELMQNSGNQQESRQAPSFNIPRDKLSEVAGKLDFTSGIPEELLTQLQSGDTNALMGIIQHVGRASYTQAMEHSMQLTDKHLGSRFDYEREGMQAAIRGEVVDTNLRSVEGMHPTALAMFRNTAQQLARENPTASQEQIESQVWTMMEDLGGQFNRTQKAADLQQKATEVNWDEEGGFGGDAPTQE